MTRSVSLSNDLQAIPDELCNLTGLTDLNLVRNKLVALPDRCVCRYMVGAMVDRAWSIIPA